MNEAFKEKKEFNWFELKKLYFNPKEFFNSNKDLDKGIFYVYWVVGLGFSFSKQFANSNMPNLLSIIMSGLLTGVLIYYIGGWFYNFRLTLCDVLCPNPKLGRLIYIYTHLIWAIPTVLIELFKKLIGTNIAILNEGLDGLELIFAIWAIVNSYKSIVDNFGKEDGLVLWGAKLLFLILPIIGLFSYLKIDM